VNRDQDLSPTVIEHLSAILIDSDLLLKQGLRRRRPESQDEPRLDQRNLCLKPWPAGWNLPCIRFLVDSSLASRLKLEVFHGVRNINLGCVDSRFFERSSQNSTRRAHKRLALLVFVISRLLADRDHQRVIGAFPEHRLCRMAK